jgi:pyridoxamine 5'-phosphate oxidase
MNEPALPDDPFELFKSWYSEAETSEPNEPNAMAVATADSQGRPSVRMVLLKSFNERGFVFFSHLDSRKGSELAENPVAALLFHWKSLCRQIRIEGRIEHVDDADADAYFASRARDSQIGAWASDQSRPLESRSVFEARYEAAKARFEGKEVPRPPRWAGFRVVPERIEFWTARAHRLHEREVYTALCGGGWTRSMLYP